MMYPMKKIIRYDDELCLPKCMYRISNPNESLLVDDINIHDQVMKFLKVPNRNMAELEQRQDQLMKKLNLLHDKIKTISLNCTLKSPVQDRKEVKPAVSSTNEVVLVLSPDSLPYFLTILLKDENFPVNISWHIHSSVSNEKTAKIKAFAKQLPSYQSTSNVNLRLIFKNVSADTELRLSSMEVPVVGNVNILRYLAVLYPNLMFYDTEDYHMDNLLDLCHLMERASEKNKETIISNLFGQCKEWIYKSQFSIIDVAAYNVIKQWQNKSKAIPKAWFDKCDKMGF